MLRELEKLIQEEKWQDARKWITKLELELEPSDRFSILNAMVYMEEGKLEEARKCITVGIICNPSNYELYYLLGNYYLNQNINQAYLCYEQALFYCCDEENRSALEADMKFLRGLDGFEVHPVSVVIHSYNAVDILKGCIDSIRKNLAKDMYELVVVDTASTDGVAQWLKEQPDIVLQCNPVKEGYGKSCNQGIALADPDNDIFLLDCDTIVPSNALFWLRMGLYERETVGAVGPISNQVSNNQQINVSYNTVEEYLKLAEGIHIPLPNAYENKVYLAGFAMLIKRRAWNEVGLLDEKYEYGNWENTDYGMMLSTAGYECLLCTNAFIYHDGKKKQCQHLNNNPKKLVEKWGIDPQYFMHIRSGLIEKIQKEPDTCFRVLEVGCGCGSTLSHIKWKYPNARVYGIELEEKAAKLGKFMADITVGNIETMELPYAEHMFDYIIFGDVLEHLRDPQRVIMEMKRFLREEGKVIASIPNLLNASVIAPLLRGRFTYVDAGLLDKTHIHLFTKYEIESMFFASGYQITDMSAVRGFEQQNMVEGDVELMEALWQLPGVVPRIEFEAYQYYVVAELM